MAATEIFSNNPSTTVTAGGTGPPPAQGTPETWTVFSSSGFPAAATGVTQFHIGDPAAPSEIILVTNMHGAGNVLWDVIRGAEGSPTVPHTAGFTVVQVVTAGWLGSVTTGSFVNPMTTGGDTIFGASGGTAARRAGNITTAKQFLTSTGSGGTANAPVWGTIAAGDVPVLNQNTTGAAGSAATAGTAAAVSGTVTTAHGGTGLGSLTTYAVVTGGTSATSPVQQVAGAGTVGQVLTSNGAGMLPSWQPSSGGSSVTFPVTVPEGGTGGTQITAYAVMTGGTSSTSAFQAVAGLGAAGWVLTSNGAGSRPSFQAATGGSGFTNPMSNIGDMIVGGASGAAQALGIGANNYVLTSNGSGNQPSWQANTPGSGVTLIHPSGDGSGNTDLANVQAALNSTGWVWLSTGNFSFNGAATLPSVLPSGNPGGSPGGGIFGQGDTYTQIFQKNTGTADTIKATNAKNFTMSGVQLVGNKSNGSTGNGIALYQTTAADTTYVDISDCTVTQCGGDGIRVDQPIVGRITRTVSKLNNSNGFNINVNHLGTGTSFGFEKTYAINNTQAGYAMYQMHYCSFVSTASDGNGIGYYLNNCNSVSFLAAGTETGSQNSGIYAGHGYYITGGADITLIDPLVNECPNVCYYVTGSAQNIKLIHPFQTGTGAVSGTAAMFVDTGCYVMVDRPDFANNTSGTITGTGTIVGLGGVYLTPADTFDRFNVTLDGVHHWGSGSGALDTNMYRNAANSLRTDDSLTVGTNFLVNGNSGFYGGPVVAQPTAGHITAGYTTGSSTNVTIDGRFTGGTGATSYTIADVVNALKTLGLINP